MDAAKLDAYLAERHPGQRFPGIHNDGLGNIEIVDWPEGLGKAPTSEEIDAYVPPIPPEKIDFAAEVDAAVTAAKSARTVVSAIEITERLAARVADIEARLAKLGL